MYPVLIDFSSLGLDLKIHTYGALIALGFVIGIHLSVREAKRTGENPNKIVDLLFWCLLIGLLSSRLLFVAITYEYYINNPIEILMFYKGGLVFYGGFVGALLAAIIYTKKHNMSLLKSGDIIIPQVALGHFFGRLGCFMAGCCWGKVCDYPWAVQFGKQSITYMGQIERGLIDYAAETTLKIHPTQIYEAVGELTLFWILIILRKRKSFQGHLLVAYMILYPILRSIIEVFRGDIERGFVIDNYISTSQFISIIVAIAGITILFLRKKKTVS